MGYRDAEEAVGKLNFRSRKLLDLAHRITECQNCGRYCADGCEPAHENSVEAGKGFGIKSHDNRIAALCNPCHRWLDQGSSNYDPSGMYANIGPEKDDLFNRAHKRTFDIFWSEGWIKVGT